MQHKRHWNRTWWFYSGLVVAITLVACSTEAGTYYLPSAAGGRVGYPQSVGSAYGLYPKYWIYFTSPGDDVFSVDVHVSRIEEGIATALQIEVFKHCGRDPRIAAITDPSARQAAIESDVSEVSSDTGQIEIDWDDGSRQIVPLAFSGQDGRKFVISGAPHGRPHLPLPAYMVIALEHHHGEGFAVRIPAMTFANGHRLEFPPIRFQKANRDD